MPVIHILVPHSVFSWAYLFGSFNLQINTYFTYSSSFIRIYTIIHTVTVEFFVPVLLCLLYLAAALFNARSHCTSILFCPVQCQFIFS